MPTVSIVVPNYNYARFLPQRLGSIEKQTYRDFEVILLDDASTDASVGVLQEYSRKNGWQLVCNEKNSGGVFKQWNKGIGFAKGKYVWIAEADDVADERFLEVMAGRLEANPNCGVAHCNSLKIDDEGRVLELVSPTMYDVDPHRWRHDFVAHGREECIRYLLRENTIQNASAVLFRRDLCEKLGTADESFRVCADWKFWASLLSISDLAFVAEPLNRFRTHRISVRAKTRHWQRVNESLRVMNYIAGSTNPPRAAMQDLHARLAIFLTYAYFQQHPTRVELSEARELLKSLDFAFSTRGAAKLLKHLSQAILARIPGTGLQRRNRIFAAVEGGER